MSFFEKDELKLLRPFYLEILISTSFFIFPAFAIIYLQEIGLSLTKIGFLISIMPLVALILEIPTGAVADIWSRKVSTLIGFLIGGISMIFIGFTKEYYLLLFLFALQGVSSSFVSGAYESWIIDNLKYMKRENVIKNFYAHRQIFLNTSFVLSGILATFLVKYYGMQIIWPVSGVSLLISVFLLIKIKEHKLPHKREKRNIFGFFKQNKESIKYSLKHKIISLILIATFIASISWGLTSDIVINPLLKDKGMPIHWLGYLFSISAMIGIFAPLISKKILKRNKKQVKYIGYLIILSAFICFSIIFDMGWIQIALIYIGIMAIADIRSPLLGNLIQKLIPSKRRATITSINSMIFSLGAIIGAPMAGMLADNLGLEYTLIIGGLITLIAGFIFLKIRE